MKLVQATAVLSMWAVSALGQTTIEVPKDTGSEDAVVGEGFNFPLFGATIEGSETKFEPGLNLVDEKEEELAVNPDDVKKRIHQEFVEYEYDGPNLGTDLDEWVKRSRKDFNEKLESGKFFFVDDNDDPNLRKLEEEPGKKGNLRKLNTFGPDNRIALSKWAMDVFPNRAVGHLQPVGCTGTMVAKNVFLTNRHCVLDGNGNLRYGNNFWNTMNLQLGRSDNTYNYKVYFNRVMWSNTYDWALVRTTYNVGYYTGYVGYRGRSWWHFVLNRRLSMLSYSGEFFANTGRPGFHIGCSSRGAQVSGNVRHDCDAERGSSGSAMLEGVYGPWGQYQAGGPWVAGVNYAEYRGGGPNSLHLASYSHNRANLFWPGHTFASRITHVRNNW